MEFLYLIFYPCLRLLFLDVETNPGSRPPVPAVCRILCSNVRGLAGNSSDLTVHGFVSVWYTVVLWNFGLRYASRVGVAGPEGWRHTYTRWLRSISPTQIWVWLLRNVGFQGLWCETEPLCVQSLSQPWPRPDLDDQIFYCLLASMAAQHVRASFLFVGDLNCHQQEWLGSTTTKRHGVAAVDFATVTSCDQLIVGPTHALGGTLDLLLTDVPDLVRVVVVSPIR